MYIYVNASDFYDTEFCIFLNYLETQLKPSLVHQRNSTDKNTMEKNMNCLF